MTMKWFWGRTVYVFIYAVHTVMSKHRVCYHANVLRPRDLGV